MPVAKRLAWYLRQRGVAGEVVPHARASSSRDAARRAHVDPERLVKSVLLEDERGYLLIALPASRRVDLETLRQKIGRPLELANEQELEAIFDDCELGAVPLTGAAYGIPMAVDEALLHHDDVWISGGDHVDLIHLKGLEFARLCEGAVRGDFSGAASTEAPAAQVRARSKLLDRLDIDRPHVFSLRAYGAGLTRQAEYERDGHTGMILVKTPELRALLEVLAAGSTLRNHVVHGPATLLVLEGALDLRTEHGTFRVGEHEMAVLPADERREIFAPVQTQFVLALSPAATREKRKLPRRVGAGPLRRILVVANQTVGGSHLSEVVEERLARGPLELVILCPAAPSRDGFIWDEGKARGEARRRLDEACEQLRGPGILVRGLIGDFYPLRAIRDMLLVEEFDEIIVSTLPHGVSEWLKVDLPSRVARRFGVPTTHIIGTE